MAVILWAILLGDVASLSWSVIAFLLPIQHMLEAEVCLLFRFAALLPSSQSAIAISRHGGVRPATLGLASTWPDLGSCGNNVQQRQNINKGACRNQD